VIARSKDDLNWMSSLKRMTSSIQPAFNWMTSSTQHQTKLMNTSAHVAADDLKRRTKKGDLKKKQEMKWALVFSSACFCIPAVLTFFRTPWLWWLTITYVTTSIVSINYWRDPVPGARMHADVCTAQTSFVITSMAGFIYVRDAFWLIIGCPLVVCIPVCYWLSVNLFAHGSDLWALAHMGMHACVATGMSIVVAGATTAV